jgi:hypothetical protein
MTAVRKPDSGEDPTAWRVISVIFIDVFWIVEGNLSTSPKPVRSFTFLASGGDGGGGARSTPGLAGAFLLKTSHTPSFAAQMLRRAFPKSVINVMR